MLGFFYTFEQMNIEKLYHLFKLHPNICTDSRKIKKASIFFALKGENFNGNEFAGKAIDEGCAEGFIEDCNGNCAPAGWLGDGFCDSGDYQHNGNPIFFDCEEFNNDNGDCDELGRTTETRPYPNGKIKINQ